MPYEQSSQTFLQAHYRAQLRDLIAWIGGRSNDLLPFDALASALQVYQQVPARAPR